MSNVRTLVFAKGVECFLDELGFLAPELPVPKALFEILQANDQPSKPFESWHSFEFRSDPDQTLVIILRLSIGPNTVDIREAKLMVESSYAA